LVLMHKVNTKTNRGFGLIEIIVGVAIISTTLFALVGASNSFLRLSRNTLMEIQATFLVQEGVDAIRVLRDKGWTDNIATLTTDQDYELRFDGVSWFATTEDQTIDGTFSRVFVMSDVYRDGNDDIAPAGTLDPGTKKFELEVSWTSVTGNTVTTSVTTYFTNLFND